MTIGQPQKMGITGGGRPKIIASISTEMRGDEMSNWSVVRRVSPLEKCHTLIRLDSKVFGPELMTISNSIENHLHAISEACVFTRNDIAHHLGVDKNQVSQALQRLAKKGKVQYISHGLWQRPKLTRFGPVSASADNVVAALERNRDVFIVPCGARVLNAIGASTQLPMKYRFLSTKPIQTIKYGEKSIEFEYSSAFASACSSLKSLPRAEQRMVAGLWGALVYAGKKHAKVQATAFRRAFDTLSLCGQEHLLACLSGRLRWAHALLGGSADKIGES